MQSNREESDDLLPQPDRAGADHVEGGAAPAGGSGHELVVAPPLLPARILAGDALARKGMSELAKQPVRVEQLPAFVRPVHGHCVVSDEVNERVFLLGGWSNDGLWAYDFNRRSWQEVETGRFRPDALGHPSVVLDSKRRRLIWFGGWPHGNDTPVDDLYVLDLTAAPLEWEYVEHRHPWPLPRNGASLVLDTNRDRCLLFGGDAGPGQSFNPLDDLWTLDLASLQWQRHRRMFWQMAPSPRWLHAAALDSAAGRMILIGGAGRGRFDPLAHELDLESLRWGRPHGVNDTLPCVEGHAIACVPEQHTLFIHGGLLLKGAGPSSLPYLWRCDLKTFWLTRAALQPQDLPHGRFCHAMCYCRHRRALFCVGGKWNRHVANYYETDGEFADTFLMHVS